MNWAEIITMIVGAFGGISGAVTLYNAKSNRQTIDISNLHSLIEEERKERQNLSNEYQAYKAEVHDKVEEVKKDFEEMRQENQRMLRAIYQAYRCRFPEETGDCPVIKMFQNCQECKTKKEDASCN